MMNFPRKKRHTPLQWKIILIYILLTVIPFSASYVYINLYWWNSTKGEIIAHSEDVLNYSKKIINAHLFQIEKLTGLIYSDHELLHLLENEDSDHSEVERIQIDQHFSKMFQDISFARPDLYNFYFFDMSGNLVYRNGDWIDFTARVNYNPLYDEWYERTSLLNGKPYFFNTSLPYNQGQESSFSISRLIKLPQKTIGVVLVNFNFNVIKDLIGAPADHESSFFWTDFDGNIIYSTGNLPMGPSLQPEFKYRIASSLNGSYEVKIENKTYLLIHDSIERYSLKLLRIFPTSQLISEHMKYVLTVSALFISLMLVLIGLSLIYFRKKIEPLRILSNSMARKVKEPFNQRFHDLNRASNDEIGMLITSFNRMMDQLEDLFQREFKQKLKLMETEKALLESQINPHFLYNTLDTIRFHAMEHRDHRVADMLYALSVNLRYTISNTDKKVTIREEVEWLERYIYLQKLRFQNRFDVYFEIDVASYPLHIYRLILQPFIENAIIHGFKNTKRGGILHINGYLDQKSHLIFEIVDNGCGFPYRISQSVDHHSIEELSRNQIGMYNALQRLFLYYKNHCEVFIHSIPGRQTAVRITINLEMEGDASDEGLIGG